MLATIQLRKMNPETLIAYNPIRTLWKVENEDGKIIGYLASSSIIYTSPSTGKVRYPVQWGFAVHVDEFRSGIQFLYMNRTEALRALMRTII